MVVAPKPLLRKVRHVLSSDDGCSIRPASEVNNLGLIFDSTLSFQSLIKPITKPAFHHLKHFSSVSLAV